ncbi:MAG: PadR family transcriptional regulator [Chloroflexota bacterium]
MLKYILLGFLNYYPMTGYDLKTRMEDSTAHFWHAYHSQIYTALRKMEEDGLLSSEMLDEEGSPTKREYTITDVGRAKLKAWLDKSMMELPRVKNEMMVRAFFSGQRDKEHVIDELRAQRQLHLQKLAIYEGYEMAHLLPPEIPMTPEIEHEMFFWNRTLDFGKRYERLCIDWLDETITAVESH